MDRTGIIVVTLCALLFGAWFIQEQKYQSLYDRYRRDKDRQGGTTDGVFGGQQCQSTKLSNHDFSSGWRGYGSRAICDCAEQQRLDA